MTEYGVNIVGSLTNNNGVLSGFSTSAYAKLPSAFTPSNDKWEVVIDFTTGNDIATEQMVLSNQWRYFSGSYSQQWGIFIIIKNNQVLIQACKGVASGNTDPVFINHTTNIAANTHYKIRFVYNSQLMIYSSYVTVGSGEETLISSTVSSTIITQADYKPLLGICYAQHNGNYFSPFLGSIDLNNSYIKIGNDIWWQGAHTYNGTHIQLRRDTAANWTTFNPVLLQGEVGLETDTGKSKVGDGSTAWNSLAYDLASTALQSHQSLAGYANLTAVAQTFTGYNTFSQTIKTNQLADLESYGIFQSNTTEVTVGTNAKALNLSGSGTRPTYNSNNIALYSDIPTVPTDISAFTNDSGYITGITSSDVTTALGYTPVNTDLSNLSATGKTVLDGQWVSVSRQIASDVSVNGSTDLTYTLSDVPNDGNKYEVLLTGQVYTSNTSSNQARINISSDIVSGVIMCGTITRTSQSNIAMGSVVIPVGNRQITVTRNTGWNGTINIWIKGYRRIGSNS